MKLTREPGPDPKRMGDARFCDLSPIGRFPDPGLPAQIARRAIERACWAWPPSEPAAAVTDPGLDRLPTLIGATSSDP